MSATIPPLEPATLYRVTLRCEALGMDRHVVVAAASEAEAGARGLQHTQLRNSRHDYSVCFSAPLLGRHASLDERLGALHVALREMAVQAQLGVSVPWEDDAFACLARLAGDCQDAAARLQPDLLATVPAWQTPEFLEPPAAPQGDA